MQGQVGHLGSFPCQDTTILMNTVKKTHLEKFEHKHGVLNPKL